MTRLLLSTALALLGSAATGLTAAADQIPSSEQKAAGQHQLQQAALPPADDDRCWIRFTEIDADDDGRVDAAEAKRHQARIFEIDKNRDGAIDRAEFAECVKATPAKPARGEAAAEPAGALTFAGLDADKDGAVTLAEYMAQAEKAWTSRNEDGGGMPMQAYAKSPLNVMSYDPATLDWDGDRSVSPNEAAVDSWYNFVALDLDEDGRVTAEEWRDRKPDGKPGVPAAEMFALMDRNDDGRITAAESAETWDQARRQDGVVVEAVPVWVYQVYTLR